MKSLDDRVAVVTGAASGVGRGIATVLAREGASVAVADIDLGSADTLARELTDQGLEAAAVAVDVTDRESVGQMAGSVLERWGRIDLLAANAGVFPAADIADITDELFDRIMGINVKGAIFSIQACLPSMREAGYGRIVMTSSITGPAVGAPGYSTYGASKAAMLGFMRNAALEVAGDGVTINAIQPGNVRTPGFAELPPEWQQRMVDVIPMGRLAEPEDLGWAVRFLASEEAGYITGQTLVLDGGQILPEG